MQKNTERQLTLNFKPGLYDGYDTLTEFVNYDRYQHGKNQKVIAADLDLSPSDWARKVASNDDDPRSLGVRDLERYMDHYGHRQIVSWIMNKYEPADDRDQRIVELEMQLEALKRAG